MVTEAMHGVGGSEPGAFGKRIMELAERLAQWSEISKGLTCTYLSPAPSPQKSATGCAKRD
jgi:hypothetical protein